MGIDGDLRRTAAWLKAHGAPDAVPTPLIAARLRARRRSAVLVIVAPLVLVVLVLCTHMLPEDTNLGRLSIFFALFLLAVLGQWGRLRLLRRTDRRLGAVLARRVTRPEP